MSDAITAVLFAGGQSLRMGRDKATIVVDGKPLWRRQLDILGELSPREVLISAREKPDWTESEFLKDALSGAGPFGGLVAALRNASTDRVLVLAIDLPKMTSDFLSRLVEQSESGRGVVPVREGFLEPLAAIYPNSALPIAEEALAAGRFAMHEFAETAIAADLMTPLVVSGDDARCLFNMNHPDDVP